MGMFNLRGESDRLLGLQRVAVSEEEITKDHHRPAALPGFGTGRLLHF